jgi:hypothetical protein
MKTVARVLEITGFFATFVVFAYNLRFTIDPGRCMPTNIGAIEWALSIFMCKLVLGFGKASRREFKKSDEIRFWIVSATYFGLSLLLRSKIYYGTFGSRWQDLVEAFKPESRPRYILEAIAPFFTDVVYWWMPFAAAMSAIALLILLLGARRDKNSAEQVVPPNGP